jgi:hypothetical protein
MAEPIIVNVPNADDVYIGGVPIVVAGKVYPIPSVVVPDTFSVVFLASPLNVGNIFISKTQPTNFNSIILLPGTSFRWRIKNPKVLNVLGTAAGDCVIITCEINTGEV